ncbi:MAG: hypothetical protein NTW14_14480 [bacterium]|nr:hypothetical protein [bacterium]
MLLPLLSLAGPLSIGSFTQLKMEYQYTDYLKYKYPNPILFEYPGQLYSQPVPYIADFPENRALVKVTQSLGINDVIHVKYQYSDLDRDKWQDLFNLKYVRNLSGATEAHASTQVTRGSGSFLGEMFEVGGRIDWAGFFWMEGSYAYYSNKVDTAGSSRSDAHSTELTLRQSLTKSTAFQVRHSYFFASGDRADFVSNTLTFWISQFFPTKTAVHLEWREHWDTTHYLSHAPAIEIDQYLSWATILKLRARFYTGKPKDPAALALIQGDHFESDSFSASITHNLFAETKVMFRYRYYWSDQEIQMNTYLITLEHIL